MKKVNVLTTLVLAFLLASGSLLAQDTSEQTKQEQIQATQGEQQAPQRMRLKDGSCQAGAEACAQNRQGTRSMKGKRKGAGDGAGNVERPRDGSGVGKANNRRGNGKGQGNCRGGQGRGRN